MKKLCKKIGCGNFSVKNGYCIDHQSEDRQKSYRSYKYKNLYYSKEWRAFRKQFLSDNPLCEVCGGKAPTVHHEINHKGNEFLFFNNRFHAMCSSCYSSFG